MTARNSLPLATTLEYDADRPVQRRILDVVAILGLLLAIPGVLLLVGDFWNFVQYRPTRWMEELMTRRIFEVHRLREYGVLLERVSSLLLLAGCIALLRGKARARMWLLTYAVLAVGSVACMHLPQFVSMSAWTVQWSNKATYLVETTVDMLTRLVLPVLLLVLCVSKRMRGAFLPRQSG